VWRRWAVSLGLLAGLLAGCHDDGKKGGTSPTSAPGGASSTTAPTAPATASPGFLAASYASDQDGWALSKAPCPRPGANQAQCGVVSKTTDGGVTWAELARLDVPTDDSAGPDFVSELHVADATYGWVYDRSLYATFNGGKRWQSVDLGNPVVALGSLGGQAYALVGCAAGAGNCAAPTRLAEGTIATGRWRFASPGFDLPSTIGGAVVSSRSAIYALVGDPGRDQILLARTAAGRWERRTVPCPRAIVAAIEAQDGLVAACPPSGAYGPTELQTSSDGGRTWAVVWQQSFDSPPVSLAAAGDAAIVTLENGEVLRSVDNGVHFSTVLRTDGRPGIHFVDAQHGFITTRSPSGGRLFNTRDGGATWRAVKVPG
jgi:photosystem II stability/assembly factor-like uncharacterized protein